MTQDILSYLPADHPWSTYICYRDTIGSTNDEAKRLAAGGAPQGTVVIAGHQTGGRGRMGRSFHSPAGLGLYLSVILRPDCAPGELMHLTCAVAVAACNAVEQAADIRPGIKWTNDLVFGKKKLGGILTELSFNPNGTVNHAVVGIGINCNHTSKDFPPELRDMASSLSMITGKSVNPSLLAAHLIRELETMNQELLTGKDAAMDRYRADCVTLGKEVSVHRFDEVRHGTAESVDDEGALLVRFSDGHTEAIAAGEVSIRGMYGYL